MRATPTTVSKPTLSPAQEFFEAILENPDLQPQVQPPATRQRHAPRQRRRPPPPQQQVPMLESLPSERPTSMDRGSQPPAAAALQPERLMSVAATRASVESPDLPDAMASEWPPDTPDDSLEQLDG